VEHFRLDSDCLGCRVKLRQEPIEEIGGKRNGIVGMAVAVNDVADVV
jgi:hypothetical protein